MFLKNGAAGQHFIMFTAAKCIVKKKKGIHLASFLNEHKGMLNVCSACVMFVYAPLVLSHQCGCLGVERYRSRNSKVKMSLVFFLFLL